VAGRGQSGRGGHRRAYSQNFLASRALAARLVAEANVGRDDFVVEIGAGSGMLTIELAARARRVRAIEVDPRWASKLRARVASHSNVEVIEGDAMKLPLPVEPFRVVANVPFGATTALLHHLLDDPGSSLVRADLLLQWEVARKRAGRPRTAVSAAWSPWWRFRLGQRIPRTAFRPQPAVDGGVLTIERRVDPFLPFEAHDSFAVFVSALFAARIGSELDAKRWAAMYAAYAGPHMTKVKKM
jgi:23S rRNA (adenine-N6)-dimethyltransferase